MSITRYEPNDAQSALNLKRLPKTASTAFAENTLVSLASGKLRPTVAADDGTVVGVVVERVTSADANYASTDLIGYDEAREGDVFIVDTDAGTVAPGDEKTINNAGQLKTGAIGADKAIFRVVRQLPGNKALVTLITNSNKK